MLTITTSMCCPFSHYKYCSRVQTWEVKEHLQNFRVLVLLVNFRMSNKHLHFGGLAKLFIKLSQIFFYLILLTAACKHFPSVYWRFQNWKATEEWYPKSKIKFFFNCVYICAKEWDTHLFKRWVSHSQGNSK